jgi:hypothetical protein
MKKIAIIAAIVFTTALTALSINRKEIKEDITTKVQKTDISTKNMDMSVVSTSLATAD